MLRPVLYIGEHDPNDPDEGHPQSGRRRICEPNAKFWRPYVNGDVFPDCLNMEIRHYWASTPRADACLDLVRDFSAELYHQATSHPSYRPQFSRRRTSDRRSSKGRLNPDMDLIGSVDGLKKFESIILEATPELDSFLLMQLLGNPNAVASNLNILELRFCKLEHDVLCKFLYHMPPNVKRLILLCDRYESDESINAPSEDTHLCPLLRQVSKNLVHLEFGADTVCRELFFDETDRRFLQGSGIDMNVGTVGGATNKSLGSLDRHAIKEAIEDSRKQKKMEFRSGQIEQAVTQVMNKLAPSPMSPSPFGGDTSNTVSARAEREAQNRLDEAEERRSRMIEGSKTPWFRRVMTWNGMCSLSATWEEFQIGADMEEKGIEWVLASMCSMFW